MPVRRTCIISGRKKKGEDFAVDRDDERLSVRP